MAVADSLIIKLHGPMTFESLHCNGFSFEIFFLYPLHFAVAITYVVGRRHLVRQAVSRANKAHIVCARGAVRGSCAP